MINQKGFTLIELMISLTLGLIISAAAILLFLTGQKSLSMQQGTSDLQDNANFGLNYITKDLRLINLNSTQAITTDSTILGGVVLTSSLNPVNIGTTAVPIRVSNLSSTIVGDTAAVKLLSQSASSASWAGLSNVQVDGTDQKSDQLTIQYMPQYTIEDRGTGTPKVPTYVGGYDCEGQELAFPVSSGRRMVVQRYFLRLDDNKSENEPNKALVLACDAGNYLETNPTAIANFGGAGEIVMKRVDYLRILLGVQNTSGRRYMSINEYMTSATPHPRIVSIQFGILARSSQSVSDSKSIKNDQSFVVLDKTVKVKTPTKTAPKYVRQVISQTIALRNAIGERGE